MCMDVRVYICTYMCICTCAYTYMYSSVCVAAHANVHLDMCTHHVSMYLCVHTCLCVYSSEHIYPYTYDSHNHNAHADTHANKQNTLNSTPQNYVFPVLARTPQNSKKTVVQKVTDRGSQNSFFFNFWASAAQDHFWHPFRPPILKNRPCKKLTDRGSRKQLLL